jgi:hypothetical protein
MVAPLWPQAVQRALGRSLSLRLPTAVFLFQHQRFKSPLTAPAYRCGRDSGDGSRGTYPPLNRGPGALCERLRRGFPKLPRTGDLTGRQLNQRRNYLGTARYKGSSCSW